MVLLPQSASGGKNDKPSQASMVLPPQAASGGFFPAKTTIPSKKVCILMVFVTFRLILTPKPSKTIQILGLEPKTSIFLRFFKVLYRKHRFS